MKRERVIWTRKQTAKLKKQILAGKTLSEIRVGGMSKRQVANRVNYLQKHGSKLRLTKSKWTKREDKELVEQVEVRGLPPRKVKVKDSLGRKRTIGAIRGEILVLRKRGLITRVFVSRAPAQQVEEAEVELIRSHTQGVTSNGRLGPAGLKGLSRLKNRSKSSIGGIIHNHGLANPELSKKSVQAYKNRLFPKRRKEICAYLRTTGKYLTDALAAIECKVDRSVITRLRKKYRLRRYSHEEAMKDPLYRKCYEAQVKQRTQTLKDKIQIAFSEKRKFLAQQKAVLASKKLPMSWCSVCGNDYPKTDVFFRQYKGKWRTGGTKYTFSSVCTACPVKAKKNLFSTASAGQLL